jgi:hypothetical protein
MAGVKFIRVHGRIVPLRDKGSDTETKKAKTTTTAKQQAKKAAQDYGKKKATKTQVAARFFLGHAIFAGGITQMRNMARGAHMYTSATMANVGLMKAGKRLMQQGNVEAAQKLGTGFARNVRVAMKGATTLRAGAKAYAASAAAFGVGIGAAYGINKLGRMARDRIGRKKK